MFIGNNRLQITLLGLMGLCSVKYQAANRGNNSKNKKPEADLLTNEQNARKAAVEGLQNKIRQVNARLTAILLIFPLADSFYNALNFLHKQTGEFFNQAQSIDKSIFSNIRKEWPKVSKLSEQLKKEIYDASSLKDEIESFAEQIRNRTMLLENDIVNGNTSTKFLNKEIEKLIAKSNKSLDAYVTKSTKLFDNMSFARHALVGFSQKLIRNLSENGTWTGLNMIENRFCKSELISKGGYKTAFNDVRTSFDQMKSAFNSMTSSGGESYPVSFVNFASKVLDFQNVKYDQLEVGIRVYNQASTGEEKYKAAVSLASAVVDFNYLYELSKHILKLFEVFQERYNSKQNMSANIGAVGGDNDDE